MNVSDYELYPSLVKQLQNWHLIPSKQLLLTYFIQDCVQLFESDEILRLEYKNLFLVLNIA